MSFPILPAGERGSLHEGTEGFAINNTFLRRLLTRLALRTLGRLYKRDGRCVPISQTKIIKCGWQVRLTEAATMKFIADNTSIPVPKVYCAFVHKNCAYIVMERIQGEAISRVWNDSSEDTRQNILKQLRGLFQGLRALQPPRGAGVESCVGGSFHDCRMLSRPYFGPFRTIQEFHLWLREGLRPSEIKDREHDSDWEAIKKMAAMQDRPWPSPVFTHADLNPSNILLRNGKVVGIIDWEFAGWYPNYWEYTSAWYGSLIATDWRDSIERFLEPFPAELEMENTRQRWWGMS